MSAKKIRLTLLALMSGILLVMLAAAMAENDPVTSYYWEHARTAYQTRNPIQTGAKFSMRARTLYKRVGEAGGVTRTDSVVIDYFYSFGQVDSQKVVQAPTTEMPEIEFFPTEIFDSTYILTFFPNDTGGSDLPIGFDSDTLHLTKPTGLAVIDRQQYHLKWLYMYYPERDGFNRFSRNFRFHLEKGYIFPDSVWVVANEKGFFYSTEYRLETGISILTANR